jgi:hypothetical protein
LTVGTGFASAAGLLVMIASFDSEARHRWPAPSLADTSSRS